MIDESASDGIPGRLQARKRVQRAQSGECVVNMGL